MREHDLALAQEVAPLFRLKPPRARAIETEIRDAVATWQPVASATAIPRSSQAAMAPAFRLASKA